MKTLLFIITLLVSIASANAMDRQIPTRLEEAQKLATNGNPKYQCDLAIIYFQGKETPKDIQKAIEYFTKAANQGYAMAQCYLGGIYLNGIGVEKDPQKAFEYHTKAAAQNYANAQYKLGVYYKQAGDYAKAIDLFSKSAKQEQKKAQQELAKLLEMKTWQLNKESATYIAQAKLVEIYGEKVLEQIPWIVEEKDNSFFIKGTFNKTGKGGVAKIEISKADASVISYTHGK